MKRIHGKSAHFEAKNRPLTDRQIRLFKSHLRKKNKAGCILWDRPLPGGYGQFCLNCSRDMAHRVAWRIKNGPVPCGLWVLHRCDVRACCNPEHLFLGTRQDNMDDMVNKNRVAHGVKTWTSKLTPPMVRKILEMADDGMSHRAIAREFGVGSNMPNLIVRGLAWRRVTGIPPNSKHERSRSK